MISRVENIRLTEKYTGKHISMIEGASQGQKSIRLLGNTFIENADGDIICRDKNIMESYTVFSRSKNKWADVIEKSKKMKVRAIKEITGHSILGANGYDPRVITKDRIYDAEEYSATHYKILCTNHNTTAIYNKGYFVDNVIEVGDYVKILSANSRQGCNDINAYKKLIGKTVKVTKVEKSLHSHIGTWITAEGVGNTYAIGINQVEKVNPDTKTVTKKRINGISRRVRCLQEWRDMADYVNGNWVPRYGKTKYFVWYDFSVDKYKIWCHGTVLYSELTYFKSIKKAEEAIKKFGKKRLEIVYK